ncbi:hypothetical protein, partial [Lacrimispora amygdalina]|uniref:hypothetical protein n=1 Tax=Lacrimispora amygdalina TaxID=253257 RepID=UPI001A9A493A
LQYLNTGIYLVNMGELPNFINTVIIIVAFFTAAISMIYFFLNNDTILSTIIAIFYVTITTFIILCFCILIIIKGSNYHTVIAFILIIFYMFVLELAQKKMKKKANKFIYICFLLALAFICIIALFTAYQNPNDLTIKSFNNAISNYGKFSGNDSNDIMNLILYFITIVYNFIVLIPLGKILTDIYGNFISK